MSSITHPIRSEDRAHIPWLALVLKQGLSNAEEASTTFQSLVFFSHLVDKFRSVPVRSQPSGKIQFIKISIEAFYEIDIDYYSG